MSESPMVVIKRTDSGQQAINLDMLEDPLNINSRTVPR